MKRLAVLLLLLPEVALAATSSDSQPADAVGAEPAGAVGDPAADVDEAEPADAQADEAPPLAYGVEADVTSRYLCRGLAWSERPVFQPSARLSGYGATLAAAGNAYLTDETVSPSGFSELDLVGRYDLVLDRVTLSPSATAFIYPDGPETLELGAALAYNLDILTVQTRHVVDVLDNAGGWYGDIGGFRSQPLGSHVRLDTTASLAAGSGAYNRYYIDPALSGMHFGAAIVDSSLIVLATDAIYVRLHGTFSHMLEKRIRNAAGEENLFGGGLALGFAR